MQLCKLEISAKTMFSISDDVGPPGVNGESLSKGNQILISIYQPATGCGYFYIKLNNCKVAYSLTSGILHV